MDSVEKADQRLRLTAMTEQSNADVGPTEVSDSNHPGGRLIARINDELVHMQALERGHILIGRDKMCDIRVSNLLVSRRHALVVKLSKGAKLVDLGSKNGTFVNGRQIKQYPHQYLLHDSDVIAVGDCLIEYVEAGDHEAGFDDPDPTETFKPLSADPVALGRGNGLKMRSLDPE